MSVDQAVTFAINNLGYKETDLTTKIIEEIAEHYKDQIEQQIN